jgi:hypothetical protein
MLSKVDLNSFLKFPFLCFKFCFFDLHTTDESATSSQKFVSIAKEVYFFLSSFGMCFCLVLQGMFTVVNWSNFMDASTNIPNVMTGTLIVLKVFAVYKEKNEILKIFEELNKVFDEKSDKNSMEKEGKYLKSYLKMIKVYAGTIICVYLPLLYPLLDFAINGKMKLPVNYWLPFDPFKPVIYVHVTFWIEFFAYNFLVFLLACDSLLYALITVIAMEFDFLSSDLQSLKLPAKHERSKTIKNFVKRHDKLLELADRLQEIFALTFLFSFVVSSLVMCFIAFQLSTVTELSAFGFYIPYFLMIAGQIWLLCLHGQKIIDSSEGVAKAVYNSGWESIGDVKFKKQLLLIMLRAQKPKKLTAMNFGNVSLESFNSVSF